VTKIHRLVLGDDDEKSTKTYKIRSLSPINIFVELNEKQYGDELSIEADQNLQKFFFTESNGNELRFYLDSYDNNTEDLLHLSSNSSSTKPTALENNTTNYIKSTDKIKVFLKTSSSYLNVSKLNFGIVNLYFKLNRDQKTNQLNSFNKINCNGEILFNNEFINPGYSSNRTLTFTSMSSHNVFVYWCKESVEFSVHETNKTIQYSLKPKIKNNKI
jgi:hypothetical protein